VSINESHTVESSCNESAKVRKCNGFVFAFFDNESANVLRFAPTLKVLF